MTRTSLLSLSLLLLSTAAARAQEPVRLTAAEVGRRAAETSPQAQARAREAQAAAAAVDQALAGYLPRLGTSFRYTRLSKVDTPSLGTIVVAPGAAPGPLAPNAALTAVPLTFTTPVNQYVASATLSVPLSDYVLRLPQLTAAARSSARAAALLEQATRLRVATEAQGTFYDWVRARLRLEVTRQSLAQTRAHLQDVTAAEQAGTASLADRLRVEAQVSSAELLVARTESLVVVLDRQLRTLMHDTSGSPYEIGETIGEDPGPPGPGEAALIDEALTRRIEPRVHAANERTLRQQASATRAAGLPRLDAQAGASYARPNQRVFPQKDEFRSSWDAGLTLSWAPTDLFSTEAGHRASTARAEAAAAERQGVLDGIRVEVAQQLQAAREADVAMVSSARGLAAAEESYRVRRLLFQNGRATSVELTDAETELLRARLEAVSARIDQKLSRVRLEHAVGRDVGTAAGGS